ncbi:MAG: NHLP-related RiPP peptide [Pseudomonadota bacterium]
MAIHSSNDLNTLLGKLSTDDSFRERLLKDPVGLLRSIGINLDPAQIPVLRNLPSKASIAADMAAVREKLESASAMLPFRLSGNT